jgi:protease I
MIKENVSAKKAVLVVARQKFQDFEYLETKKHLIRAGIEIIVVSSSKGEAFGDLGGKITIDKTIKEIKEENFDALIFIGGPGALEYVNNSEIHQLIKQILAQGKIIGAICIAPVILAQAGILKGRKATVWTSPRDQSAAEFLKKSRAEYLHQKVVVDENIITANGPEAVTEFGQIIAEALSH